MAFRGVELSQHHATWPGPPVAVTGATGKVGALVAAELRARGSEPRLIVRDPARLPTPAPDVRVAEFADSRAVEAALRGVRTVLMVSASESPDRRKVHRVFVDAAARAGVQHIVYTSFLGAAPDAVFTLARDHFDTEQAIVSSGVAYTFLRDSLYADFIPGMAVDGRIRGPAAHGRLAPVARADVARAAAAVLQDPPAHAGRTYDLTGPAALTMEEVSVCLSEASGAPVVYEEESIHEAYRSREVFDAPRWQVEAWVSTYTAIAAGELDVVSDDVRALTGRGPLSLPDVVRRQVT